MSTGTARCRVLLAMAALAFLVGGCGGLGHADAEQPRAETVTIVRAIDGDTIRLTGSGDASRLRLIGPDTPTPPRRTSPGVASSAADRKQPRA